MWFLEAFENYLFYMIILTIIREKQHVIKQLPLVTIQKIFTNLLFSETLKSISNTLQNLTFVQLSVDEIVGGPDTTPRPSFLPSTRIELSAYKVLF